MIIIMTYTNQVVVNYLLFYHNIQCFTMAMPFNMILILYVIPCKLSCDVRKLTILYIHVHIFYHFYDKYLSSHLDMFHFKASNVM